MFGTIRKHQTWLWAIIITLTIISFVIFFSPVTRMDRGRGAARLGSINGQSISEEQYVHAQRDVTLQFFFMSGGRWPDQDARQMGFDAERETYQWLMLQQKAEQLGIHPNTEVVARVARDMVSNFQRSGVSSPQVFLTDVLQPHGLTAADFERFVRRYLSIQQLIATIGMAGRLVPPEDLKSFYTRERQELQTEAVMLNASNYVAQVKMDPALVSRFYSNRLADFRIPERVQIRYIEYPLTNFYAAAEEELMKTNLNEVVDMNLQRLGTNFVQFGATPEEAKAKIRTELIRNRGLNEARRRANEFATHLLEVEPARPENLELVAATNGVTVKTSAPFDRKDGPKELEIGANAANFANAAFALSPTNDLFAGPLVGQNGAYVIGFDKRIPSEIPPYDQIQSKVEQAFKDYEAASLARTAGIEGHQKITNSVAQGKTFEAAAKEAGLNAIKLPPFSMSSRTLPDLDSHVNLNDLKQLAFSTEAGKISPFQSTADGGFILHVVGRIPVDEAKYNSDLAAFKNYVRQSRQTEAFNLWFSKEASQALRDTPIGQPRPAPSMGAPSGASKS
jgi:hypothetical protein